MAGLLAAALLLLAAGAAVEATDFAVELAGVRWVLVASRTLGAAGHRSARCPIA
jgi:hypothetical protein